MDGPVSRHECKRAAMPEKLDSDNREHLAFSDRYGRVIRKENSLIRFGGTCVCCLENVMMVEPQTKATEE